MNAYKTFHISLTKICLLLTTLKNSPVIKNFLIYSCGSLFLRSVSVLLAPITLTLLSPQEYGLLSLITSFTNIFVIFLGFGLRQAFSLEYFHHDTAGKQALINTILIVYLFLSTPVLCILFYNKNLLNAYLFACNATPLLLHLSFVFCFLYFFVELFYQVLQYESKAYTLTLLQIVTALITIACNIFLLKQGYGISGMMTGYVFTMFLVTGIALYAYTSTNMSPLSLQKSLYCAKYYITLGIPFIPGVLFGWVLSSGDRWVLAHYATLRDVGIYSLADTAGSVFQMLVLYPLSCSYLPYLFKQFAQNKKDIALLEAHNKTVMFYAMAAGFLFIVMGYFIAGPLLKKIIPSHYHEAITYVWLILSGNIFLMGSYFANALIQFHKKSFFLSFALLIPATLNILLNVLLIRSWGIYGCTIATVISYACYFLIILFYNNRLLSVHTD